MKTRKDFKTWDEYEVYAKGYIEGQEAAHKFVIENFIFKVKE